METPGVLLAVHADGAGMVIDHLLVSDALRTSVVPDSYTVAGSACQQHPPDLLLGHDGAEQ